MINYCPCHFQMLKPDTTGIVQSVLVRVILAQFAWDKWPEQPQSIVYLILTIGKIGSPVIVVIFTFNRQFKKSVWEVFGELNQITLAAIPCIVLIQPNPSPVFHALTHDVRNILFQFIADSLIEIFRHRFCRQQEVASVSHITFPPQGIPG